MYSQSGIISLTICHNPEHTGSRKLYYYTNNNMFHCYTGCENSTFDIFELVIKIYKIQKNKDISLATAIKIIASRINYFESFDNENNIEQSNLKDWAILSNYERIQNIQTNQLNITLKEYDKSILSRFNYNILITPWLKENISQEVIEKAQIGFYPGGDQITIPHFDINGRFIGLRGRTLSVEESKLMGKYRPLKINNILYNHPLGLNLYNINNAQKQIKIMKKAIVFEAEKSVLKAQSALGFDNDIYVAVCGSNLTLFQLYQLLDCGAEEIIIAFDKQYEKTNTLESKLWEKKLMSIYNKYKNYAKISFLWDKEDKLETKMSPIDNGLDNFIYLYNNRIVI